MNNTTHSRKWLRLAIAAGILLFPVFGFAAGNNSNRTITVMTRNLYDGVDAEVAQLLQDLSTGASPEVIVFHAGQVMAAAKASDFPGRAALIAKEVASVRPELISVQEAILYRSQCPTDWVAGNADFVEIDFLHELLTALANERLHYEVVAVSQNIDIEMPGLTAQGLCDLRMTDRDVVLARTDEVKVSNVQAAHYATVCYSTVPWIRGWISADVKTNGRTFRFISTHLDIEECAAEQTQQAMELLAGSANTDLPVVVAGDLNSDAYGVQKPTPTYPALIAAGFVDTWSAVHGDDVVYTCCHDPHLANPVPFSSEQKRIDVILTRGGLSAITAVRLGADPEDRTAAGLWASDHAGMAARVAIH
ncbi:MAG TPA: endonuclease/exonuclease/phosphatase family protein [Thermoanaerobaculia bacterium]